MHPAPCRMETTNQHTPLMKSQGNSGSTVWSVITKWLHPALAPVGLSAVFVLGALFKGKSSRDYTIKSLLMLGKFAILSNRALITRSCSTGLILVLLYWLRRILSSQQSPTIQYVKSIIVQYLMSPPLFKPETCRGIFMDLPDSVFRTDSNHTHPESASNRNSSVAFIERLADVMGRTAYHVQRSRADERNGRIGSRALYWAKDLTAQPTRLVVPHNPLMALCDVDQYIDMPSFLCDYPHPTCIYTFQPDQVCKEMKDYSYTFDALDGVSYNVAGGGRFQHQVWNYGSDHFVAKKTFLGIPYRVSAYLCDRRATSPDHELIMLTPLGSWSGLGAMFFNEWIFGRRLQRLKVVTPSGFLRLTSHGPEGIKVSTGRPDSYVCATIPAAIDDTIATVARSSQYPLVLPQVMSYLKGDRVASACVLEYHRANTVDKPDVVCPLPMAVRSYQFHPNTYMPGLKAAMKPFMSPLVHGAFVPTMSVQNEEECIRARVIKVKPGLLPMKPILARFIREFARLFIPDSQAHTLDPVDHEEVTRRQERPAQRRLAAVAEATLASRVVAMFNKKEPYGNVKPSRAISVINSVDKREYSRYIYAFEAFLKAQPWYAFGLSPRQVAQRVTDVLHEADDAANTDFNKFDGHGSNVMRELETVLIMRAFRLCHHAELSDLHRSQFGRQAFGMFRSWYETEFSRLSGSPETSCLNSVVNAFVSYCALRMTKVGGVYIQPEEAYKGLGIYGGDDGLTANLNPSAAAEASALIGQELTVEVVPRGSIGIKFLARVYSPNVWYGDMNTCCDLPRQLSKLHVTVNMGVNVTPKMKLLEKVRSFMLSDESTPVIGMFCCAVQMVNGEELVANDETRAMRSWNSRWSKENQYINEPAEWFGEYCQTALPGFEFKRFSSWVQSADTFEKLLSAPNFMEPVPAKSEVPVVIEDDVIPYGPFQDPVPLPQRPEGQPSVSELVPVSMLSNVDVSPAAFMADQKALLTEGKIEVSADEKGPPLKVAVGLIPEVVPRVPNSKNKRYLERKERLIREGKWKDLPKKVKTVVVPVPIVNPVVKPVPRKVKPPKAAPTYAQVRGVWAKKVKKPQ